MKAILFLGLLTGLDDLQVTPALGLLKMTPRRRLAWAVMFGLAEALMPLLGMAAGSMLKELSGDWAEKIGPVALVLCGLAVVVVAMRKMDVAALASSKWAIVGLPLALSIDNLLAGVGVGAGSASPLMAALVIGGISTTVGLIGLYAGQLVRRWVPATPDWASGVLLITCGIVGLC